MTSVVRDIARKRLGNKHAQGMRLCLLSCVNDGKLHTFCEENIADLLEIYQEQLFTTRRMTVAIYLSSICYTEHLF